MVSMTIQLIIKFVISKKLLEITKKKIITCSKFTAAMYPSVVKSSAKHIENFSFDFVKVRKWFPISSACAGVGEGRKGGVKGSHNGRRDKKYACTPTHIETHLYRKHRQKNIWT